MSLQFNLNINIELSYDTPKGIIEILRKKMNGEIWNESDKSNIPFQNEIEYLFETEKHQREQCLQTFHFQKQEYLKHPEFRKLEDEFYCFHLSRTIKDDGFYQGGYELIVWLANYSRTNGYIGEYHEPESKEINLLFTKNGIVTVRRVRDESMFKMSSTDFNFDKQKTVKLKRIEDMNNAINNQNWIFAKIKIDELLKDDPNNLNYESIKEYLMTK